MNIPTSQDTDHEDEAPNSLTFVELLFCEEFLKCFDGRRAALRAGFSVGMATQRAGEMLSNVLVRNYLDARFRVHAMRSEEVLHHLAEIARGEYQEYMIVDENGIVHLDFHTMQEDGKLRLIKKIKDTQNGREIDFYDRMTALGMMAKYHKILVERSEISGPGGGPVHQLISAEELRELTEDELARLHKEALGTTPET